jgi:hypothetical protein
VWHALSSSNPSSVGIALRAAYVVSYLALDMLSCKKVLAIHIEIFMCKGLVFFCEFLMLGCSPWSAGMIQAHTIQSQANRKTLIDLRPKAFVYVQL